MSNYTKTTNFTAKDSLLVGDPNKIIKGTEHDVEYDAIATAVNSKANTSSPTFTGTANFSAIASGALTGTTINNSVIGGSTPAAGTFSTFTLASGTTATAILDEDTLVSNSATALATQQSIKAYVDAQVISAGPLLTTGTITTNDFARFTNSTTLEGRSAAEVKADLGLEIDSTILGYVAPSTLGNILTSDGTNWTSSAPAGGGSTFLVDRAGTLGSLKTVSYPAAGVIALDSTRYFVIMGSEGNTTADITGVIYDSSTDTWGTETTIEAGRCLHGAIKVDTDKILVAYSEETSDLYCRVLTISGTTITVNAEVSASMGVNLEGNSSTSGRQLNIVDCQNGSYVLHFYETASDVHYIVAITVSGTTPSIGSPTSFSPTGIGNLDGRVICVGSGYFFTATKSLVTTSSLDIRTYSVSGTTITSVDTATTTATTTTFKWEYMGATSSSHHLLLCDTSLIAVTFDGSYNISKAEYSNFFSNSFNYPSKCSVIFDDSGNALILQNNSSAINLNTYSSSGTSIGSYQIFNAGGNVDNAQMIQNDSKIYHMSK